ncbi:hypothetical protein HY405_00730 [Candidatus Microgenomates bacterium]|nr:hypothetical protein [Candidatus Microgenomates bacterium]
MRNIISNLVIFAVVLSTLYSLLSTSPTRAQEDATQPGRTIRDTLRERVEERLAELTNKPRAFVGKISEIADSVLILETKTGTKQIKIEEDAVVVQTTATGAKTIKATNLAIGNFVVAMGYLEDKNTLDATRILTMTQTPLTPRYPVYGLVESVEKGTFTVKHPKKDETWTVRTTSNTRVTAKIDGKIETSDVDSIEIGDRIIALGTDVKNAANTISARLIHVIPRNATGLLGTPSPESTKSPSPTPKPTTTPKPTATP